MKKSRFVGLLLLAVMILASVSSAAPMTSNPQSMPRAASTGAHGTNEVIEGISPVTGLPWNGEYRPLVVQMSNAWQARPHWYLSEADIVYESILWGPGHTRYTAIFNDNHPDYVGPLRSARVNHCEIREEWDAPFVFWGGQADPGSSIYDFFRTNEVPESLRFDGTRGRSYIGPVLFRDSTRVSPHNAVGDLSKLVAEYWPKNEDDSAFKSKMHALKFSDTPSRGPDSAVEIDIVYDEKDYHPSYKFNPETRVYERWYNGQEMIDGKTDKKIVASNVIVQYTEMQYINNRASRPVINMTGSGYFDAFIDGYHLRGTWERKNIKDRTVFMDGGGEEITLLPGKTFIQVIPNQMTYQYTTANGNTVVVDVGYEVKRLEIDTSENIDDLDKMEDTSKQ